MVSPQSLASQGAGIKGTGTQGTGTQGTGTQQRALYRVGRTLGLPGGLSVLVTRVPTEDGALTCGGEHLVPQPPPACSQPAYAKGAIAPGQRFTDPASGLEVVCTWAGYGVLAFAGRPLRVGLAAAVQSPAA